MIPKIFRGQKLSGLMVYLLGEGEHNEHRHRHVVAGSPSVMQAEWLRDFDGPQDKRASRDAAIAIAHEMDLPRQLHGTQARMRAKVGSGVGGRGAGTDVVVPAAKGEKGVMRNAPVWHCVIALNPGEELSDEKWGELANEFMTRMGFNGSGDGSVEPARWAAVRHGRSGEDGKGQDHIHIAASLIREDGSKVSTYDYGPGKRKGDRLRAQDVAGELEREFGLKVLPSREEGGGHSGNSRAEIERAARIGAPETERERLRRVVRAAATAKDTEADFVRALREAGISVAPRWAAGGRTEAAGYKVRWRRDGGEVGPWVGGGKLDHDLTLTALREQQWADSPEARAEAATAWRGGQSQRSDARRSGPDLEDPQIWRAVAAEIGEWRRTLEAVPAGDRAQWAWAAGQASGVFAAFSEALEGDRPGVFAAAAKELARSAQVQYASQRYQPRASGRAAFGGGTRTGLGAAAAILFDEAIRPGGSRMRRAGSGEATELAALALALLLALLVIAIAIAAQIATAHRARGQVLRAVVVDQSLRGLDPVRRAWDADLQNRGFRWDRDIADVFTAAVGRRVSKVLGESTDTTTAAATVSQAEQLLGADRVREITEAADALVARVSEAPAWPALLARLAELESEGRDAIEDLTTVVAARELSTADDMAAVLSWRIENMLDTTAPTPEHEPEPAAPAPEPERRPRPDMSRAKASAQGPLTPPEARQRPRRLNRPFFSELSEQDRALVRTRAVAAAGSADSDIAPRTWDDDRLGGELLHRRAEVTALREELEARRVGGPQVAQVRADNEALAVQARMIAAAKKAAAYAEQLEAEQSAREQEQDRIERERAATAAWNVRARGRLDSRFAELDAEIDEHADAVEQARYAADVAADATGVAPEEWAEVLHNAAPAQCQRRMREAEQLDEAALREDATMLRSLERDLKKIEAEHTRRGRMTAAQRAQSVRDARTQQGPARTQSDFDIAEFMGLQRPQPGTGMSPEESANRYGDTVAPEPDKPTPPRNPERSSGFEQHHAPPPPHHDPGRDQGQGRGR